MTAPDDVPVVSIVGKSDSGKTTVVEGLIRELTSRGLRVATVKHHIHEVDIDQPGKDSWRHAHAGAAVTMISSPLQFAVVRRVDRERTLEEICMAAGDVDIVVTEGFQRAGEVRIEVSRAARSEELVNDPSTLFALVTDNAAIDAGTTPRFALDDVRGLADLIQAKLLQGREGPGAGGGED